MLPVFNLKMLIIDWCWQRKESYRNFRACSSSFLLQQDPTEVKRTLQLVDVVSWLLLDWLVNWKRNFLTVMSFLLANDVLCASRVAKVVKSSRVPCHAHWPKSMRRSWKILSSLLRLWERERVFALMVPKLSKCTSSSLFYHDFGLIDRFLDAKDSSSLDYKLDSFSSVYNKLTGKTVVFEFPVQPGEGL